MILTNDPRQLDMAQTPHDSAALARRLSAAPMKARKAQLPADHGLFSDEAEQLDLSEAGLFR